MPIKKSRVISMAFSDAHIHTQTRTVGLYKLLICAQGTPKRIFSLKTGNIILHDHNNFFYLWYGGES